MIFGLKKLRNLYRRYRYERVVSEVFFDWVIKHTEGEVVVLVSMDTLQGFFQRKGQSLTKLREETADEEIHINFSLCVPSRKEDVQKKGDKGARERISLFASDFICIDEYIYSAQERLLRHGLIHKEKECALDLARQSLRLFLQTNKGMSYSEFKGNLSDNFKNQATVDVTLWVAGKLRGSIIFSAASFFEAIVRGAMRSARDSRFRPLEYNELEDIWIEITVLSDLRIPLPETDICKTIMTEKGYRVEWHNRIGWYLPSVFNVVRFSGISDFLSRLAGEKAGISPGNYAFASFSVYEVESFTENSQKTGAKELRGSLINNFIDVRNAENITSMSCNMADWLCRIQYPNGYFPQYADPYASSYSRHADWSRMAFTAFALGVYGRTLNMQTYCEAADITARFVHSVFNDLTPLTKKNRVLTLAYLGRLALVRQRRDEAKAHASAIQGLLFQIPFSPVVFLQCCSFFLELSEWNIIDMRDHVAEMLRKAVYEWDARVTRNEHVSFAGFAELIPLLFLFSQTRNPQAMEFRAYYQKVREWYVSHQYANGSFPDTVHSPFTYTRGTGKIFEALAIDKANLDSCFQAFEWIRKFQYSEDSLFNVIPQFRDGMRGSVMHDDLNHTAWIDSAAHVLIGVSRLLKHF